MEKILSILVSLFLIASFLSMETSFAEEKAKSLAELTNEELCEKIKNMIEAEEDVLDYIPKLKIAFDESGEIASIEYEISGIFKHIEELNKETLIKIYARISNERVRIISERMIRQLEMMRPPQTPSAPPKIYTPPTVPSVPTTPQPPPKTPAPPHSSHRK